MLRHDKRLKKMKVVTLVISLQNIRSRLAGKLRSNMQGQIALGAGILRFNFTPLTSRHACPSFSRLLRSGGGTYYAGCNNACMIDCYWAMPPCWAQERLLSERIEPEAQAKTIVICWAEVFVKMFVLEIFLNVFTENYSHFFLKKMGRIAGVLAIVKVLLFM